jgi:hypothetical protein
MSDRMLGIGDWGKRIPKFDEERPKVNPMRRPLRTSVLAVLAAAALVVPAHAAVAHPGHGPGKPPKPASAPQLEKLDRGLVALPTDGGIHLTWRLLREEATGASETGLTGTDFVVRRDGKRIATVTDSTTYVDAGGTDRSRYTVSPLQGKRAG